MGDIVKYLPLLGLLLCLGCNKTMPLMFKTNSLTQATQPGTANVPVIIVAGQSNAVGYGDTQQAVGPEITWVGLDVPRGIGVYFTQYYLQNTGHSKAIVIQCAVGATSIAQWAPGGALETQCQAFYNQVIQSTPSAKLATILFYQGESDSVTSGTPWASEFSALVHSWRNTYGNVPIEFVQLAALAPQAVSGFPYWRYIQAQQSSVSLPNVTMVVSSDQVSPFPDGVHIGTSGLIIIADRLAQAYFGSINE